MSKESNNKPKYSTDTPSITPEDKELIISLVAAHLSGVCVDDEFVISKEVMTLFAQNFL